MSLTMKVSCERLRAVGGGLCTQSRSVSSAGLFPGGSSSWHRIVEGWLFPIIIRNEDEALPALVPASTLAAQSLFFSVLN